MGKTAASDAHDPAPQPPPEPDLDACCGQGCDPCVLDLYQAAQERYRAELQAWEERQARRERNTKAARSR
jgi:hypothetical protein